MIDEKGRILGKVSIVDLAILLIVLALAFAYLYRDRAADVSPQAQTIVVEVVCANIYPGVENSLQVGDTLVASGALTNVKVTEMRVEDANWSTPNADGQVVLSKNPFRKDIFLTLEGKSSQVSAAEITFAGQKVQAGKDDFYVKTQKVSLKAIVISVSIEP
ncbi:MAG: DUF4330 domain-containing protein [Syntrophomonadaceae bacterium]|nr:DUF4330 domain-containing protein [Syntrophomonadaceae bacterium]